MPHAKKFSKRTGMVLTEALVAIATLSMGVISLGTITTNSISTTILAKDYLVARGLFKEGEEAVKNIRYSNWMLKPANKECWLRIVPDNGTDPTCTSNPSLDSNYIALIDNGIWTLESAGANGLNLEDGPDNRFQMYLNESGYKSSLGVVAGAEASKFYRSVKFLDLPADNSKATFEIKVQWLDGAKTREISTQITLYNYL